MGDFGSGSPSGHGSETAIIDAQKKAAGAVSNGLSVNWLPGPDSNQRHGG